MNLIKIIAYGMFAVSAIGQTTMPTTVSTTQPSLELQLMESRQSLHDAQQKLEVAKRCVIDELASNSEYVKATAEQAKWAEELRIAREQTDSSRQVEAGSAWVKARAKVEQLERNACERSSEYVIARQLVDEAQIVLKKIGARIAERDLEQQVLLQKQERENRKKADRLASYDRFMDVDIADEVTKGMSKAELLKLMQRGADTEETDDDGTSIMIWKFLQREGPRGDPRLMAGGSLYDAGDRMVVYLKDGIVQSVKKTKKSG